MAALRRLARELVALADVGLISMSRALELTEAVEAGLEEKQRLAMQLGVFRQQAAQIAPDGTMPTYSAWREAQAVSTRTALDLAKLHETLAFTRSALETEAFLARDRHAKATRGQ